MAEAAYLRTIREGGFDAKLAEALESLSNCAVCPRKCSVNRVQGELGFCGIGRNAQVASAHAHYGEEAPLVGDGGSGTIFFTSCNLKCVFCQNYEISQLMEGGRVSPETLGEIMVGLQRSGCHNINFVTPSHVVPQILEALPYAVEKGLRVPLVYNSGGYDSVETLRLLDGIVDIYMPDLKFMDPGPSELYMNAPDYPDAVTSAIREMSRQVGDLVVDDRGIAIRGLLVRHLVMPHDEANTRAAMRFLAKEISSNTYVNIMNQYRPCGRASEFERLGRSVTREEYLRALEIAHEEGIRRLDERVAFRLRMT